MKTTSAFVIFAMLLIAGSIAAYAGRAIESAIESALEMPLETPQDDIGVIRSAGGGWKWTAVTNSPFDDKTIFAIAYGNNRFVAGSWNGKVAYSTDGANWTAAADSTFGGTAAVKAIAYGGNRFVAANGDGKMAYSADGASWIAVTDSTFGAYNNSINAIAYANGRFVAAGSNGKMAYSTDGASWIAVSDSAISSIWQYRDSDGDEYTASVYAIAYGNNRWVAAGTWGKMAYSADGVSWTAVPNAGLRGDIHSIAHGGNRWIAGDNEHKMAYSTNGASWRAVPNSKFGGVAAIKAIAYGGARFVAANTDGQMTYSTDGVSWTLIADSAFGGGGVNAIAYGIACNTDNGNGSIGPRFVAVGDGGRIAHAAAD